ncbi:hypothetical protein D9611_007009 [Ephemerocybe angulata]|uniref:Uncharacterized protein n=1 Tax=Ephemerocybe angulata TaxID=980116 RepID=A0A8H5B1B1_9AGAR|nr:hypothetical protein D9611_007009 [Tulosesus angulatus]
MSAEDALLQFAWFVQKGHWFAGNDTGLQLPPRHAVATATVTFWDHISTFDLEVGVHIVCGLLDADELACNSYTLIQFWLAGAAATAMQAPTSRTCLPGNWPSWSSATWFISITYDIVVVAFTVWEGLRFLKESQKEMSALETDAPPDNYLKTLRTWSRQGKGLAFYPIQATSALTPILGCRLVLNLRNAYYQPFSEEMRMSMKGYDLDMLNNSVEYPLEVYTIKAQGMGSGDDQARTDQGAF